MLITYRKLFFIFHRADTEPKCDPVTTVPDFDLFQYTRARWFVHQLAPTRYVPIEKNYCAYAEYSIREDATFPWGYTVDVNNYVEDKEGNSYGGELCAYEADPTDKAKLGVAPCFLPKWLSGPYWVLAYDEKEGYALISGGQPTVATKDGCRASDVGLESGLWVFLRTRKRNNLKIEKVRRIAKDMGLDVNILNDVDQTNCEEDHMEKDSHENIDKEGTSLIETL